MSRSTYLFILLILLSWSCGESQEGTLEIGSTPVVVDGIEASGSDVELAMRVTNPGNTEVRLTRVSIITPDHSSGAFSLPESFSLPRTIAPGEELSIPFQFSPLASHPGGCDLFATTEVEFTVFREPTFLEPLRGELIASGPCDSSLRCSAESIPVTVFGFDSPFDLQCYNLSSQEVTVTDMTFTPSSAPFEVSGTPFPRSIARGTSSRFSLQFSPLERGDYDATLQVHTSEGHSSEVFLQARSIRARPLCSDPVESRPGIPESINGYTFDLESPNLATASGRVRATTRTTESRAPMLERSYLLASGAYLNEFCEVSLGSNGTSFRWEGLPCTEGEGTLFNVITIPLSDEIRAQIRTVSTGDTVQFEGYDIDRINREGWWSDGGVNNAGAGNRAMFITRVCDP